MEPLLNHSTSVSSPESSSTMPGSPALRPTWHGYVKDTRDALILFEATITGNLTRVIRRPHDRERATLVRSGSIFIYAEDASGIKRWTDGVTWSPSRILSNFLIYRELEKPFAPGEKKRATKKPKREHRPSDSYPLNELDPSVTPPLAHPASASPLSPQSTSHRGDINADWDADRSLVGSLTDSYQFKKDGLVKKTMSVKYNGHSFHMVSYYTPEDVKQCNLLRPCQDAELMDTPIRAGLLEKSNFRSPIEGEASEETTGYPTPQQQPAQFASSSYGSPPTHMSPGHNPGLPHFSTPQLSAQHVSPPPLSVQHISSPSTYHYGSQMGPTYDHQPQSYQPYVPSDHYVTSQQPISHVMNQHVRSPVSGSTTDSYTTIPTSTSQHFSSYGDQRPLPQYSQRGAYGTSMYNQWERPGS